MVVTAVQWLRSHDLASGFKPRLHWSPCVLGDEVCRQHSKGTVSLLLRATLCTRAWGPMTFQIQEFALVENAKICHFTIILKRPRKFGWMKNLHGMQWVIFHGLPDFASSPPWRGGPNTKLGDYKLQNLKTLNFIRSAYMSRMVMKYHSVELSHMSQNNTWRSVTTLKININFPWDGLGMSFMDLTMSWSHTLAIAWSGAQCLGDLTVILSSWRVWVHWDYIWWRHKLDVCVECYFHTFDWCKMFLPPSSLLCQIEGEITQ